MRGNGAYGFAWQPQTACTGVVGLYPPGCWASRPCPRPYPLMQARPKQGLLAPAVFTAFIATTSPSDSLSARRDFALGLYATPSPDVGCRVGSPQFPIRLSQRARFHTPGVSCALPVSQAAVCCLRREMIGSATPPFGFLSHEAAKFTLSHWAHWLASLAHSLSAVAGLLTLRSDAAISDVTRSLLRGAPALTAAGLSPASLMQHRDRTVQVRYRSGRNIPPIVSGYSPTTLMSTRFGRRPSNSP
jgi:hypothetical protein